MRRNLSRCWKSSIYSVAGPPVAAGWMFEHSEIHLIDYHIGIMNNLLALLSSEMPTLSYIISASGLMSSAVGTLLQLVWSSVFMDEPNCRLKLLFSKVPGSVILIRPIPILINLSASNPPTPPTPAIATLERRSIFCSVSLMRPPFLKNIPCKECLPVIAGWFLNFLHRYLP